MLKKNVILSLRCLQEFANVRQTIFDGKPAKCIFISNFVQNFINSYGNAHQSAIFNCILQDYKIFRELLKLITKFQFNFGLRGIMLCEDLSLVEKYIQTMYNVTMTAWTSDPPNKLKIISELMAQMNFLWQKFNFETS